MSKKLILSELVSGLSVSFAALAMGAAFGVMSGRGAFAGMLAAGVIPIITGIFGGTRLSVSGPTAPMTAVSSVVVAFAYDNFAHSRVVAEQFITLIFLLMSVLLLIMGLFRAGEFIRKIPQVVIIGFMSGIALLIWMNQTMTLFGWGGKTAPAGDMMVNVLLATTTFVLILSLPTLQRSLRIPKGVTVFLPHTLMTIIIMTLVTSVLGIDVARVSLGTTVETLSEFTAMVQQYFPTTEMLSADVLLIALPYAVQLTLLCYLDSLLTALVMDYLTKQPSDVNRELIGQGLANGVAALLMGIPGAQATIRSVLLFMEGGKTRLSAVSAGVFVIVGFVFLKDFVTLIASAVFIGVLFKIALDVFERQFIAAYLQRGWYRLRERNIQLALMSYTMLVTAFVDLNVAVISGTVLFRLSRKYLGVNDVEQDLNVEEPTELWIEEQSESTRTFSRSQKSPSNSTELAKEMQD